jgi:heme-degrading monooxygenase HmoA
MLEISDKMITFLLLVPRSQIYLEVIMAIKVVIKRHLKKSTAEEAIALLNTIRRKAMGRPGYISGETWVNHYDPNKITVVSTWQTIEDWIHWEESDAREANEAKLDNLLKVPAKFEIYDLGILAGK